MARTAAYNDTNDWTSRCCCLAAANVAKFSDAAAAGEDGGSTTAAGSTKLLRIARLLVVASKWKALFVSGDENEFYYFKILNKIYL